MATIRLLPSLTIAVSLVMAASASHSTAGDIAAGDRTACDAHASGCRPAAGACDGPFSRLCARCRDKVCVTIASPGKRIKSCWEVECDEVCIPAVRFPWDCRRHADCGGCVGTVLSRCGKVRGVRKLKSVESECDCCEYDHRIADACPAGGAVPLDECVPPPAELPVEGETDPGALSRAIGHSLPTGR